MGAAPKAISGLDDWLFLCNDTNQTWDMYEGRLRLDDSAQAQWREEFVRRGTLMRALGIHYRYIIVPNKECVLPDMTPPELHKAPFRLVHQVRDAARGHVHDIVLEPFILNHPERLKFFDRGDTHWNAFGAWHVVNHILAGLEIPGGLQPISEQEVSFRTETQFIGDLSRKFDPPISPGSIRAQLPHSTAACRFDNRIVNHGNLGIWEGGAPDGPVMLVFGDSFASEMVRYLAHRARRLVRVHTSAIDREILFRERPDIVLSVSIERFLRTVPPRITDFSYKTDLRQKLGGLDPEKRAALLAPMHALRTGPNAAYAADMLASAPLE
ncbi:alginate O-acetyltransferase AlgX-related protein [Rhodobacter viridis]|nr:hypothetical protein [Rhodobacter viridis]